MTGSAAAFGGAVAAVDWRKRRKLVQAARAFLAKHPWDGPCHFDVVALDLSESTETGERGPSVTLLQNAFQAEE